MDGHFPHQRERGETSQLITRQSFDVAIADVRKYAAV
jgi:hypothetical protein